MFTGSFRHAAKFYCLPLIAGRYLASSSTCSAGIGAPYTVRILLISAVHSPKRNGGWRVTMPAEWQIMHCELAISAPAPGGKTCSLSGRVILMVRFKAAADGAFCAGSAEAAEMPAVVSRINISTFRFFMFRHLRKPST